MKRGWKSEGWQDAVDGLWNKLTTDLGNSNSGEQSEHARNDRRVGAASVAILSNVQNANETVEDVLHLDEEGGDKAEAATACEKGGQALEEVTEEGGAYLAVATKECTEEATATEKASKESAVATTKQTADSRGQGTVLKERADRAAQQSRYGPMGPLFAPRTRPRTPESGSLPLAPPREGKTPAMSAVAVFVTSGSPGFPAFADAMASRLAWTPVIPPRRELTAEMTFCTKDSMIGRIMYAWGDHLLHQGRSKLQWLHIPNTNLRALQF
ncbi:hypothetical protein B0H17DRAFT_1141509 [Mycena rosella]|uniref:Uncharacterized protein n=1 Tax=Mycena rosella TaxID=1033263 RepID=A0AAD7CZG3_MYCRO|nr:hypothetical protein B0H17DRAFT_1141509 [Mycena rosella]